MPFPTPVSSYRKKLVFSWINFLEARAPLPNPQETSHVIGWGGVTLLIGSILSIANHKDVAQYSLDLKGKKW